MARKFLRIFNISPYARYVYYDTNTHSVGHLDDFHRNKSAFYFYHPEFNLGIDSGTGQYINDIFFINGTGNPDFAELRPDNYVLEQYCLPGTNTLRVVTLTDPIAFEVTNTDTPNSSVCGFTPNDVKINSITQAISGSDTIATINATGTNTPLTYSLDGVTYQVSNQFTISTAGTFIAYVKDNEGNIDTESFIVSNQASYGLKYYAGFLNDLGYLEDVNISELSYAGSSTEVQLGGTPIKRKENSSGDEKYKVIKGGECTVTLISDTNYKYLDLFTAQDRKYRLDVLKNNILNYSFANSLEEWIQISTGSTWVQESGKATVTKSSNSNSKYLTQDGDFRIGVTYTISADLTNSEVGAAYRCNIYMYTTTPGDGQGAAGTGTITTGTATISTTFTPSANYPKLAIYIDALGGTAAQKITIDNVKVSHKIFTGFLATEAYSEDYIAPPYEVSATFLDGLGLLKRRDFTSPTDQNFNSIKSQLEVIKICLLTTGLELPIFTSISIYESLMTNQTTSGDPLTQAFVNTSTFYDKDGNPLNCYDVLESILIPYGARIYFEDGNWLITNIDEINTTYNRRKYTAFGEFISTDTYNPVKDITGPSVTPYFCWASTKPRLEIKPAYKEVEIETPINQVTTLINNGDFETEGDGVVFEDWTDTSGILEKVVSISDRDLNNFARILGDGEGSGWTQYINAAPFLVSTGATGLKLNLKIRFKAFTNTPASVTSVQCKFMVKLGAYWMDSVGDWQSTETFITPTATVNVFQDLTIDSKELNAGGGLEFRIYQGKCLNLGFDLDWVDVEYVDIKYVQSNQKIEEKKTIKIKNEGSYVFKPNVLKSTFSDFPEYTNASAFIRNVIYTSANGSTLSTTWKRSGITESRYILDLLAERILNNHESPGQVLSGTLYGEMRFSNVITDEANNPGKKFLINSMEVDEKKCLYQVELVELVTVTDSTPYRLTEDGDKRILEGAPFGSNEEYRILEG